MNPLGFFGKPKPLRPIPAVLPDDSFNQAFKPFQMDQPQDGQAGPGGLAGPGKGGKAWAILGVLGDALAAAGGQQPVYLPTVLNLQDRTDKERQQLAMLAAQQQNKRQDYAWERQYDIANPKPSDDSFTRAMEGAGIAQGTPEYLAMAKKRADMLTQPVQLMPDGMGGYTAVRPNNMGGGFDTLPQGYTIRGGGAGNGAGGFRP